MVAVVGQSFKRLLFTRARDIQLVDRLEIEDF